MPARSLVHFALAAWAVACFVKGLQAADHPPSRPEDPYGLALLAGDSLIGWQYGPPPRGWTIADGELTASASATPLLGGWTLGNFELCFEWLASRPSAWVLRLPAVGDTRPGTAPSLEIHFREGDSCAATFDGQRVLATGGEVETHGRWHATVIRRDGRRMLIEVDQRPLASFEVPSDQRYGLGLAVAEGTGRLRGLFVEEPVGYPLFNGRDLEGWESRGLEGWEIHDGELVMVNGKRDYLRTKRAFANFTLSLEYKLRRRGNSGIGIRTPPGGWPSGDGIELQLEDEPAGTPLTRSSTMGLYGNLEPLARADRSEQWNRVVIKTEGAVVTAWINGVLVQHANLAELPELSHRHLEGWIGIQDHGAWIRVRNVNLLEAPAGPGPAAWYARRAEPASQVVLDRLMNSHRLAATDGVRGGLVRTAIEADGEREQLVAELAGPGALVSLAAPHADARLALYLDGREKPLFECAAAELARHLPQVGPNPRPFATWLAYRQRLRLTVRDPAGGTYLVEHVDLPADMPGIDPAEGVARGMLPALSYRYQQFQGGRHRELDPWPRASGRLSLDEAGDAQTPGEPSTPVALEPGEARRLVELDGAGIVHWFKLEALPSALAGDDLWLEVHADRREEPLIAAPARYLFAPLQPRRGFHNFLFLESEGVCAFLAMPFSDGLAITARNRGPSPLRNLRMTVSVEPPRDAAHRNQIARLGRLEGRFLPAEADADRPGEFVRLSGSGRLIGLVCAAEPSAEARPPVFARLVCDGVERPGWTGLALDELCGLPGETPDARLAFSGRGGGLIWRYLTLAPVEFQHELALSTAPHSSLGNRLVLYYAPRGR